jgi:hypothetical protein
LSRFFKLLFLAAAVASARWWLHPKTYPAGVLITGDPKQTPMEELAPSFDYEGFTLKPLARYELSVQVLHKKRYYGGEAARLFRKIRSFVTQPTCTSSPRTALLQTACGGRGPET